ncbi:transcription factor Opi1, partial [Didymella exigua CBS 183.55]
MQEERQRAPPPAYVQHAPESVQLPSVPTHAPTRQACGRLPGIQALDLPAPFVDVGSPMDTASVRSETSVTMDDPDVRLAAEALSGLGNPDFVRSPTTRSPTAEPPQPMLSLLTSNHPWLGGTISGSLAAYNLTKDYSPRFVKYGAELVERNVGSPVVNTVSSVGRRTGMEENLRRYLGEQRRGPSDVEQGELHRRPSDVEHAPRKRQRAASPGPEAMQVDSRTSSRTRAGSQSSCAESLPAYDDQRSPSYEEEAVVGDSSAPATAKDAGRRQQPSAVQDRRVAWSTQLIMTTSGLGVALSAASLRSLKQCLHLLRGATTHIDGVMHALKLLLAEYEAALRHQRSSDGGDGGGGGDGEPEGERADHDVRALAARIKTLSSDIWQTLQGVVQSVSRYTGGALPQNASQVVRTQLLSVPQRWQLAARRTASAPPDEESGGAEAVRGANRMLAFAIEGLDMMGQITTVVDGTVRSAESWLASIGRPP